MQARQWARLAHELGHVVTVLRELRGSVACALLITDGILECHERLQRHAARCQMNALTGDSDELACLAAQLRREPATPQTYFHPVAGAPLTWLRLRFDHMIEEAQELNDAPLMRALRKWRTRVAITPRL
jgi:hypothetical protein